MANGGVPNRRRNRRGQVGPDPAGRPQIGGRGSQVLAARHVTACGGVHPLGQAMPALWEGSVAIPRCDA